MTESAEHNLTFLTVPVFSDIANLAFALRREVFVVEQNVKDDEFDADDLAATHVVCLADGAVVGTLRIIAMAEHVRIGRVVVRMANRGRGVGGHMIAYAMSLMRRQGHTKFWLSAQASKTTFYERLGFVAYGPAEDDGSGIVHRAMKTY